jgi:hypothetical protein
MATIHEKPSHSSISFPIRGLLYGVRPTDPLTFVAVTFVLMAVALAACYISAMQAMRIEHWSRCGTNNRVRVSHPIPAVVRLVAACCRLILCRVIELR